MNEPETLFNPTDVEWETIHYNFYELGVQIKAEIAKSYIRCILSRGKKCPRSCALVDEIVNDSDLTNELKCRLLDGIIARVHNVYWNPHE